MMQIYGNFEGIPLNVGALFLVWCHIMTSEGLLVVYFFFFADEKLPSYLGVSLNNGTPQTPQTDHF